MQFCCQRRVRNIYGQILQDAVPRGFAKERMFFSTKEPRQGLNAYMTLRHWE